MAVLNLYLWVFLLVFSISTPSVMAQFNPDKEEGSSGPVEDLDLQPTDVIIWTAIQASRTDKHTVEVGLRLQTKQNFSIYKKRLKFSGPTGFTISKIVAPDARTQKDPLSDEMTEVYWGGEFLLTFEGLESYQGTNFPVAVTFLGCTERICLFPYTQEFDIPLYDGRTSDLDTLSPVSSELDELIPPPEDTTQPKIIPEQAELGFQEQLAERLKRGELSLAWLLVAVFLGGLLTNLTPCVFPMIPITIRLLGGQAGKKLPSALYAAGIVSTYTIIGSVVALTGGVFGSLLGSATFNIIFGLLFIGLAFNMLGYGNMALLQQLGSRFGSQKSPLLNYFLMGSGAGLVAAPCTGPILGALFVFSAQLQDSATSLALFFLYSLGFGLPYVVLGMLAGKATQIKLSAKLQVFIKLGFASIMLILSFYYLKNPAYDWLKPLRGDWFAIAVLFLSTGVLGAFLVLNHSRWIHQKTMLLVPTLLLGTGGFAAVQVISGEDLDVKVHWYYTETAAFEAARQQGKPILVDGWADWCAACKEMDATTFQDEKLVRYLSTHWIMLKLDMTEFTDENEALAAKYGMQGLPTLVLLPSSGSLEKTVKLTGYVSAGRLMQEVQSFEGN